MTQFKPHEYQRYCIRRLIDDPAVGLFIAMGLGKTIITLTAVKELKFNRFAVDRVLVIAPKKVAEATWSTEAAKWEHLKDLRVSVVIGTAKQREKALAAPADVFVINRENTEWLVNRFDKAWPFDMVVLDESSSFKNHQAKRFRALRRVRAKIGRIVELTGTPAPNGLLDLWAQLYLLDGGERLGRTIGGYRERYFLPDQRSAQQIFTWKLKPGAAEAIHRQISDICISMKAEDYLQLPDIVEDNIPVVLDPAAQRVYNRMEKELLIDVDDDVINASTAASLSNKLLQLCNGAVYNDDGEAVFVHDCKVEAFRELLEQLHGQPALVFYNYRHDLPRIRQAIPAALRVRELRTPEDIDAWNGKEVDVLLAHPASTAYGLNLQDGGNHIVWFGLNWSLELYQQANKRLHRQGQTQKVIVHHLAVQGGRDEDVLAAISKKGATQEDLIESLKARIEKVKGDKQ